MILPVFFLPAQAIDLAVSGAGNLENRAPAVLLAPLIEKFIFQDRFALSGFPSYFSISVTIESSSWRGT